MSDGSTPAPTTQPDSGSTPGDGDALGYTLYAVLRRVREVAAPPEALERAIVELGALDVEVRGLYDVSGMRADADLMIWLTGPRPEALQSALRRLRRVEPIASLEPTWSAMGVHRDAEFSRSHAPAFFRGLPPKTWLTVYPFVRSYDWYLLPEEERRTMLADHGRKGSQYPQVQANTVASFALGDYEWLLALEADELVDLVDLMRHLRNTEARRHVREEVPFYTGRMITPRELLEVVS
ncbi:hydrogen peroxide-dependent heme synthase [Homoserinibacter sp. YIM 151385]|uniref:hydrogen peroxide-dependent heme synthase n=1 Tax=Homoserinibacter sp. YIM 151385 TaxID=2985506 RepID=UPI0022F05069|nr:hydrogen peroxide-dependent heme synthase [Homoserinibacter sp. YIM 151385]WBU37178.1 chlorite dismutase family protein [Homoserinibacter sp. YIM 151385]